MADSASHSGGSNRLRLERRAARIVDSRRIAGVRRGLRLKLTFLGQLSLVPRSEHPIPPHQDAPDEQSHRDKPKNKSDDLQWEGQKSAEMQPRQPRPNLIAEAEIS